MKTNSASVQARRLRRRRRIRRIVQGSSDRPRVSVFRSSKYVYAQVIDDVLGATLASVSTAIAKDDSTSKKPGKNKSSSDETSPAPTSTKSVNAARMAGNTLGKKIKDLGISSVVFDRSGYKYTGRIQALADGIREQGIIL